MRRPGILMTLGLLLFACGCGGSKTHTAASHPPTTTTSSAVSTQTGRRALEKAIRTALDQNNQLSGYVLRTNRIPAWAVQSTAGPALAALRASAAARRKQGVRVEPLSQQLKVLAIQLAPSYTSATATISDSGRVALYTHGRQGRTLAVNERALVVLHRRGQAVRFLVWEVHQQK